MCAILPKTAPYFSRAHSRTTLSLIGEVRLQSIYTWHLADIPHTSAWSVYKFPGRASSAEDRRAGEPPTSPESRRRWPLARCGNSRHNFPARAPAKSAPEPVGNSKAPPPPAQVPQIIEFDPPRGSAMLGNFFRSFLAFVTLPVSAPSKSPPHSFTTRKAISFSRRARSSGTIPPAFNAPPSFAGDAFSNSSGPMPTPLVNFAQPLAQAASLGG